MLNKEAYDLAKRVWEGKGGSFEELYQNFTPKQWAFRRAFFEFGIEFIIQHEYEHFASGHSATDQ